MKYRIISSKKAPSRGANKKKGFRLRSAKALGEVRRPSGVPVENAELFGFGCFYEPLSEPERSLAPIPQKKKRRHRFAALARAVRRGTVSALRTLRKAFSRVFAFIRERFERKKEKPYALPALCGALCAAFAVALLSGGVVIYKLFVEDYFGSYDLVSVPDFVGNVYPNTEIFSETEYCNITVSYEYSSDIPEGTVISQMPPAGVQRRVYSNKSLCNVNLVVSLGERTFTMNDYSDHTLREAALELKKEAVRFSVVRKYSDTVGEGKIISTSPEVGEIFSCEQTVTLCVSMGPEIIYVSVPELYGMTESRAEAVLRASGLTVGDISYAVSEEPRGTVISQSITPYSSVKEGETVSFTVSAGVAYNEKLVPDLYGLTVEEAREKLAEYGLVCGNIYAVANGAPSGTVIAQSPIPETPITSGLVSVDIYVSS
ncbi:MAG: PASTA domain-containing protein [Clostridia bacterium]|nr:PASTA domain-containing protein [Clostridia bacterium]